MNEVTISNQKLPQEKLQQIASNLDTKNLQSIITYGQDINKAFSQYSGMDLNKRFNNKSTVETAQLLSDLMGEVQKIDIDDFEVTGMKKFFMNVPVLRGLVKSLDTLQTRYNTVQQNIDGIMTKLEQTKMIAMRDNNSLEVQYNNNINYINQLEQLIQAGEWKIEEIKQEIVNLQQQGAEEIVISDAEYYLNALEKRIGDLKSLQYVFKQSLFQIRIIQRTNIMDISNTDSQLQITLPIWKNQMSIAIALYNQQQSISMKKSVNEATNKMLIKNSEMLKRQTHDVVKQANEAIISVETLKTTTQNLYDTINNAIQEQNAARDKRLRAEKELKELEDNYMNTRQGERLIISKELQG